jgi:hypothetical protein
MMCYPSCGEAETRFRVDAIEVGERETYVWPQKKFNADTHYR